MHKAALHDNNLRRGILSYIGLWGLYKCVDLMIDIKVCFFDRPSIKGVGRGGGGLFGGKFYTFPINC